MKKYSTALVILSGICWGIISIFIRTLTASGFSSMDSMFCRAWGSVLLLGIYIAIKDPSLFRIRIKDCWMFVGTGLLSLSVFSYCYFSSIILSGAAVAVVLLYTSPIFVMLMSAIVFKEKITSRKLFALALTFAGCVLTAGLIGSNVRLTPLALLLGLGSGIGYASYSIFGTFAVRRYSSLTITFYTLLLSGIATLFLADIGKIFSTAVGDFSLLPYIIGLAAICTAVPYIAYTIGLANMEPSRAAVLVTVEPLVGTLLGILAYHEPVSFSRITGIVLIFAAVIILAKPDKSN